MPCWAERLPPKIQRTHMPIPELKKLQFLLRFQERDLAALRRHRNPDAKAIALNERMIAQLKDKIARLTDVNRGDGRLMPSRASRNAVS